MAVAGQFDRQPADRATDQAGQRLEAEFAPVDRGARPQAFDHGIKFSPSCPTYVSPLAASDKCFLAHEQGGCESGVKHGMIARKRHQYRGESTPMNGKPLINEPFGPLQGVRIISSGTLIAQPFAGALAAEMGAEVIQIERPVLGDAGWRTIGIQLETNNGAPPVATNWIQERRNVFCVTLDLSKPRGREVFSKLIPTCDIWMESSKPGTYAKWGSATKRCGRSIRVSLSRTCRATARMATRTTSTAPRTISWDRPSAA